MNQITTSEPQPQAPQCSVYYPDYDNSHRITINPKHKSRFGFTLVELSIVLVIIGLIAGSVLVGSDLIASASRRAQIGQLEKYQTAVHTFRSKYNGFPGDILFSDASQIGLDTTGCDGTIGKRDGTGTLDSPNLRNQQSGGELALFWRDLSFANLIDGSFNTAVCSSTPNTFFTPVIEQYIYRTPN